MWPRLGGAHVRGAWGRPISIGIIPILPAVASAKAGLLAIASSTAGLLAIASAKAGLTRHSFSEG
jgi:hypothetical protein